MADTIVTAEKLNEIKTKLNNELTVPLDALLHVDNVLDVQVVVWEVVVLVVLVLVDVLEIVMVVAAVHLAVLILVEDAPDV